MVKSAFSSLLDWTNKVTFKYLPVLLTITSPFFSKGATFVNKVANFNGPNDSQLNSSISLVPV